MYCAWPFNDSPCSYNSFHLKSRIHEAFPWRNRKMQIRGFSHFQWPAAVENTGTSYTRLVFANFGENQISIAVEEFKRNTPISADRTRPLPFSVTIQ